MNEGMLKFICAVTGHNEETIKQMFNDWLKSPSTEQARSVVEPEVSFAEPNQLCPICYTGHNSKAYGGNDRCFHCSVCGFVECNFNKDGMVEWTEIIKNRLTKFYNRAKSEARSN